MNLPGVVRDLAPALAALWIVEGWWGLGGGWLLRRGLGGRTSLRRGRFRWASPTPGDEPIVLADDPGLATETGVWIPLGPSRDPGARFRPEALRFVPWDALPPAEAEGPSVRLGRDRLRAASPGRAVRLARRWNRLRTASVERRTELLAADDAARAAGELSRRRELWRRETLSLRAGGLVGLALAFLAPAAIAWGPAGGFRLLPAVLAGAAVAWIGQVVLLAAARRRLRAADATDGTGLVLAASLSPAAAFLAAPALARDLAAGLPAWMAAAPHLDGEERRRTLARELWGVRQAIAAGPEGPWAAAWRRREAALIAVAGAHGLAAADLEPRPREAAGGPYCPLCEGTYVAGVERCLDCGLPLAGSV